MAVARSELDVYGERDGIIIAGPDRANAFAEFCLQSAGITAELLDIDTPEQRAAALEKVRGTHIEDYLKSRAEMTGFSEEELLELLTEQAAKITGGFLSPTGIEMATGDVAQVPIILSNLPPGWNLGTLRDDFNHFQSHEGAVS